MPTTDTRLGALDRLMVEILKDWILSLDDKWLDAFEELAHDRMPDHPFDLDEGDESVEAWEERWGDEIEKIQDKVMRRIAGAITHYATGTGDSDRLIREMNRQLGAEEAEQEPHVILVHTPAAHLVRQV